MLLVGDVELEDGRLGRQPLGDPLGDARAPPKLEISTVAPCSWATLAAAKPIEVSIVTPATRIRLPSRMPMVPSVPHAESAVDRDDGPGDVGCAVGGQPQHGAAISSVEP